MVRLKTGKKKQVWRKFLFIVVIVFGCFKPGSGRLHSRSKRKSRGLVSSSSSIDQCSGSVTISCYLPPEVLVLVCKPSFVEVDHELMIDPQDEDCTNPVCVFWDIPNLTT